MPVCILKLENSSQTTTGIQLRFVEFRGGMTVTRDAYSGGLGRRQEELWEYCV